MTQSKLTPGQKVYFLDEKLPYEVKATSDRYAVVSRKLNRREDAGLLKYKVEMSAYFSFTEAFNDLKDSPVYSIIDFKEEIKAPDNLIFTSVDYFDPEDCQKAIKMLESGEMELSHRNRVDLKIDWEKTNKLNTNCEIHA